MIGNVCETRMRRTYGVGLVALIPEQDQQELSHEPMRDLRAGRPIAWIVEPDANPIHGRKGERYGLAICQNCNSAYLQNEDTESNGKYDGNQ